MSAEARRWGDAAWQAVDADAPHIADAFAHAHVLMSRGDVVYVEVRESGDGPVTLWRVESFGLGGYLAAPIDAEKARADLAALEAAAAPPV